MECVNYQMVRVPRELLERALKADASIGANAIQLADGWKAMAELRAMLTAQPQASAAQSAPEGEREAFEAAYAEQYNKACGTTCTAEDIASLREGPIYADRYYLNGQWKGWQARAAWQRTQSAGVPEGWRLVPVEPTPKMLVAYMNADGAIKRWKAMLAAATAQPAAQDRVRAALSPENQRVVPVEPLLANPHPLAAAQGEFGDAYQGAREDLAIWKRRALEAEARVRHQDQIIDQMGEDLNAINGPTFMGEPVIPAAQDQGEVQRLRDVIKRVCQNPHAFLDGTFGHAELCGLLAASTGQEV